MVNETIFQHWIVTQFILPFAFITAIAYGILEKTKLLGDGKHQLNAIISFVIGLTFVGAIKPKLIVGDLILFLTVGLVVLFVILLIWGFISGKKEGGFELEKWMKWTLWIAGGVAVVIALIYATGVESNILNLLFRQEWSSSFWTNLAFIAVVSIALALVLRKGKKD